MCFTSSISASHPRTWRLRNQAIVLMLIESVILLILILIADYQWQQMVQPYFINASHTLMGLQFNKEMLQLTSLYTISTKQIIQRNLVHILKLKETFEFLQKIQIQIEQPMDCLTNLTMAGLYAYNSSYCYEYYGQKNSQPQDQYLLNFTSMVTQTYIMQDLAFNTFFASVRDSAYYSIFPGQYLNPSYDPHKRPWYVNDIEQNQSSTYYVSPPFKSTLWNIFVMTLTTDFLLDGVLEGVAGSEINLNTLTLFQQKLDDYDFKIIGHSGIIYLSTNNSIIGTYIQNQSVTGFNSEDFNQIILSTKNSTFISNCVNTKIVNLDQLCRINSINNTEQFILASKINNTDLIILLFVTPSHGIKEINDQIKATNSQLDQLFLNFDILYLTFRFTSISKYNVYLVMCTIIFYYMLAPIQHILKFNLSTACPITKFRRLIKYKKSIQLNGNDVLSNFQHTHDRLMSRITHSSFHKCLKCLEMENIQQYQLQSPHKWLDSLRNDFEYLYDRQVSSCYELTFRAQ